MSKLLNLPTLQDLNNINYILLTIADLSNDIGVSSANSVKRICSSRVLGGRPINFLQIIDCCEQMKLINRKNNQITITGFGKEFIALNTNRTYELSDSQKHFLIERIFFQGAWKSHGRGFFLNFSPNYDAFTFEYSIRENPLPGKYNSIYQLLRNLKVIEIKKEIISVNPIFVRYVKDLLAQSKSLTDEQLKKLLDADEELGLRAEEAVLMYERKRLLDLERMPEADLVRRISHLSVGAGYDIESFDGDSPGLAHDRFIEVKASKQNQMRFYWSFNEYKKATILGNQCWIYFVGNFQKEDQENIIPVMLQNPVNKIPELAELNIRVAKYIVEETKDLPMKQISLQHVKGYLL
jgi:hypothetical protein